MDQRRTQWLRRGLAVVLGLAFLVGGLEVWDRARPKDVAFGIEDLEARAQLERIVSSHGYSFKYYKNVRGETLVVVDRITSTEVRKIDCEFWAWVTKKQRAAGVVVYDKKECAL